MWPVRQHICPGNVGRRKHGSSLTPKPGLKPKPSPSPAQAIDQGLAPHFHEPEPYQAKPKLGHLGPARPCKPLLMYHTVHTQDIAILTSIFRTYMNQ